MSHVDHDATTIIRNATPLDDAQLDSVSAGLQYKLDRAFIKSWSTSGDADDRPTEEVAFYYNRIAPSYLPTKD